MNKKDVVVLYPIFLECGQYTLDPFWIDIFTKCSQGKFPKGMRIGLDGAVLIQSDSARAGGTGSRGTEKNTIPLKGEPVDIFKILIHVFKEKLKLVSDRDKLKQQQSVEKTKRDWLDNYDVKWSQIKAKRMKDKIILDFVLKEKEENHLTDKQTENLLSIINLGFAFKFFINESVDYRTRKIWSIEGLEYNKKTKQYFYGECNRKDTKTEKTVPTNKMANYLEKYIRAYEQNKKLF